jgi:hypothetical protein
VIGRTCIERLPCPCVRRREFFGALRTVPERCPTGMMGGEFVKPRYAAVRMMMLVDGELTPPSRLF